MKQEGEIKLVGLMIRIYCHHHHHTKKENYCEACQSLFEYAKIRRIRCIHGDKKPFCSNCPIHCYQPEMREKIVKVMRFSGKRIVFSHPLLAFKHLFESLRQKRRLKRKEQKSGDK